ncbi:HET-domain-containing protein, partial [Lizonia empirigonia]
MSNYERLGKSTNPEDIYIRLFCLLPGPSTGPIHGQLKHVLLSQAPPYEGLSYCWGRQTDTGTVFIASSSDISGDGTPIHKALNMPGSLIPFLNRSRPKDARAFWIDAVCINQKDDKEKTSQVLKMRDIYMKAKRTLSWLGPEADESAEA